MPNKVHAVGVIFEDEHGRILVLRRHPQDPEGTTWGLPGGKLETGETKEAAAIREVQEEIGHAVDSSKLQFIKSYHWPRNDIDLTFEVFKVSSVTDEVMLEIDEREHTEHLWAVPRELHKRPDLMEGLYPILKDAYEV